MTDPKTNPGAAVAVVTTLYGKDPLDQFEKAIASIEGQDIQVPINIYLCVDGPLPNSHESWLGENIGRFHLVLQNDVNMGLAKSLNRLIEVLGAEELVFRMDGDDISLPTRFSKQTAMMQSNPTLGIIGCQAEDIDDNDTVLAPRTYPTDPAQVKAMLCKVCTILHPTFCIRRSILCDPVIRYPDSYLCEDWGLLVIMSRAGIVMSNHPETLFQWRTGANFFARRRNFRRGWAETALALASLRDSGRLLSLDIMYPFARFVMRCLPMWAIKILYRSGFRRKILNK